jgi:hypothetical protein
MFPKKEEVQKELFADDSLIAKIARGEYPEIKENTKYGDFVMKYPSGADFALISRKRALALGGMPTDTFPREFLKVVEREATLSVVITKYPQMFEKDEFKLYKEDLSEFPDEGVKNALFNAFNTFFNQQQNEIQGVSKQETR